MFGLITHLPENVTKWIGGQATSLGEQQDEARIRGIAVASGGQGQKMASSATGALKAGDDDEPGGNKKSGAGKKPKPDDDEFATN